MASDPAFIPQPSVKVAFELMQRLRSLPDAEGANRYLPHRWRMIFRDLRKLTSERFDWEHPFTFLNVGAGARNTLSLALLFCLAGAERAWSLEPHEIYGESVVFGLQEQILDVLVRSCEYDFPTGRDPVAALDETLDVAALLTARDFRAALDSEKRLQFLPERLEGLSLPDGSVDFLYSRSTLEHLMNPSECFTQLVRVLSGRGLMIHDIDLSAHDARDELRHLYSEGDRTGAALDALNRLRRSDYEALFAALGCVTDVVRSDSTVQELDRDRLLPRMVGYSEDDLKTTRMVLLVRRTA